jgi:hypothetical protein
MIKKTHLQRIIIPSPNIFLELEKTEPIAHKDTRARMSACLPHARFAGRSLPSRAHSSASLLSRLFQLRPSSRSGPCLDTRFHP